MEDILLLIAITYCVSLFFGHQLEKHFKIPWMFASLFFGLLLSTLGLFRSTVQSDVFKLLETFGMYFLLFIIGFNLDFRRMGKMRKYAVAGAIFIVVLEGFLGSLLLYFVFPAEVNSSYLIALVVAMSFATVGEAVLLPILSNFGIIKTTFGQLTLAIGTLDDIIEVLMLAVIAVLPGLFSMMKVQNVPDPLHILLGLVGLLFLTFAVMNFGDKVKRTLEANHPPSYVPSLLMLLVCFSFITVGGFVFESLSTVGAIFAGMAVKGLLPKERLYENEKAAEFLGYIFLSPIFFLSIGASVSVASIVISPSLIVLIWIVAKTSKLLSSFLLFRKLLGNRYSLLLGLGLSVRFSTSLIIQFILLSSGLISLALYSALIATAILMKPVIIGIYSWGLSKGRPP